MEQNIEFQQKKMMLDELYKAKVNPHLKLTLRNICT